MSDTTEWKGKWGTEAMECDLCGHKQVSLYPICCERVECDNCGTMMPTAPIPDSELGE